MRLSSGTTIVRFIVTFFITVILIIPSIPVRAKELQYRIKRNELAGLETKTDFAKSIAEEAAKRFAERYGIRISVKDLKIYDLSGDGSDLFIMPAAAEVEYIQRTTGNGSSRLEVKMATAPHRTAKQSGHSGDIVVQGEDWVWVAGECFARYETTKGWADQCYKLHKYPSSVSTGNGSRDAYALHHWATVSSKSGYVLFSAKVWNAKHSDSWPMEWADWQPRSDREGDCTPIELSFTIGIATVSHTLNACEKWDITKYTEPGIFSNQWSTFWGLEQTDREVGYGVEVFVPVGGWPRWWLYVSFDAQ